MNEQKNGYLRLNSDLLSFEEETHNFNLLFKKQIYLNIFIPLIYPIGL